MINENDSQVHVYISLKSRFSDFVLHNVFCIDESVLYATNFNPSDTSVWPDGPTAFTSGSWHRMEYKQVGIPGSTNAQYSITINDIEIFTKSSFQNKTPMLRQRLDSRSFWGYSRLKGALVIVRKLNKGKLNTT